MQGAVMHIVVYTVDQLWAKASSTRCTPWRILTQCGVHTLASIVPGSEISQARVSLFQERISMKRTKFVMQVNHPSEMLCLQTKRLFCLKAVQSQVRSHIKAELSVRIMRLISAS